MIKIFTDGSCNYLTSAGGYAGIIILPIGKRIFVHGGAHPTSVERMELLAMVESLRTLRYLPGFWKGRVPVTIVNDREDVLRQLTGEFESKHNLDLWYEVNQFRQDFEIHPVWMERNSHPALAQVDLLSTNARESMEFLKPHEGDTFHTVDVNLPEPIHENQFDSGEGETEG